MTLHTLTLALIALLAGAAQAQPADEAPAPGPPARNGNVWNGQAHQPAAGPVQGRETQTGIAPDNRTAREQQGDLDRIGRQMLDRAGSDARAPAVGNTYGTEPGGVVPIAPAR